MPPKTTHTPEQVAAELKRPVDNRERTTTPIEYRRNRDLTKGIPRHPLERDTR